MPKQKSLIWGSREGISWADAFSFLRQAPLDEDIDAPFCILSGTNGTKTILPFEYRYVLHYDPTVTVKIETSTTKMRLSQAIKELGLQAKYTLKDIRMSAAIFKPQFNDKTREF